MGIAVLDVQWVSRGVTGLLGMWDRHHGSKRGTDGCVEAVFSVLGSQGGEAAGDTTTKTISAHVCEGLCKQSIPSLLSPADRLFRSRARGTLFHQLCSMLVQSQDSPVFIGTGTRAAYGCLLLKRTEERRAAGYFNAVCNLILDVMGSFCTTDLKVTLFAC